MKKRLASLLRSLGSFAVALILALTVWVVAITSSDPTEERRFSNTVTVELTGLGEGLVMTNVLPEQVSINLRAPASTWKRITNSRIPAKAIVDVTGLEPGEHEVPVKIQIGIEPILITSFSPQTIKVILERYETRTFDLTVVESGVVPTAFKAESPVASQSKIQVSGSVSLLDQIDVVRVILDHSNATESIKKEISVAAVNKNGSVISSGLTFLPEKVEVTQEINLRGGYRVVAVKVVTPGTVPSGYRVSKITVDPSVVTIYSSDRTLLESLPSFVETESVDLSTMTGRAAIKIGLVLPDGVSLVGDQSVSVDVDIVPIEGALTLNNIPVYVIGLDEGVQATLSPEAVDLYLSGPQPVLDQLNAEELYAVLDLQDYQAGHYQLEPRIDISSWEGISIQSIMPGTIDITISGQNGVTAPANGQSGTGTNNSSTIFLTDQNPVAQPTGTTVTVTLQPTVIPTPAK